MIMHRYVEKKLKGERNLPQVLGLTASPGTGKAKTLEGAVKHVLQVCRSACLSQSVCLSLSACLTVCLSHPDLC